LLDSIDKHFVSDVPVGLFLSGGIDSTALLALATEGGRKNLQTFSVGSDDPEVSESDVAARSAGHFQTTHSVMELDGATARGYFDEFLRHMDQPSVDGFNTYTVSKFARSHGMKVVLSGLGGDELFGGYASFSQVPKMVELSRKAGRVRPLRSVAGRMISGIARSGRWSRLGEFLTQTPSTAAAYGAFRGIFTIAEATALAKAAAGAAAIKEVMPLPAEAGMCTADEISALEITTYMRNQLLRDSDVMSMANSLELRVPFVDRDFVDTVTRLPASARIRPGKQLLLDAVPEIPAWVAQAPKRGFRFPFEKWITNDWTAGSRLATDAGVRPTSWYQQWTIFVFEEWVRRTMS
jgi:asparagine synthase (glutamine-hydrolysing)